ncbi:MAG: FGGY-family carbohydrate kinase [Deinococcales bacterium]
MKKHFVIAHDLGTSGDKATLFDSDGGQRGSAFHAYETEYPRPGWAEQDAEAWWSAVCSSTRALLDQSGVPASDVAAIGFSGQMMGCVPLAEDARPLRKAIIWADHRALDQERWCAERVSPDAVYDITGHRLSASNSLCKMLWLRDNEPQLYAKTHRFVQAKDAIVARLTGNFVTDFSDASGTNLLDLGSRRYSETVVDASQLDPDKLPTLAESTSVAGTVLPAAAEAIGLEAGTAVVIGAGDGACATLGAGAYVEGRTYASVGSSAWIALASERPLLDPQRRTFTFAHIVPGLYIPCGTMQAAGISYRWVAELLSGSERPDRGTDDGLTFERLNELASAAPAGSRDLIFLPYLLGERSPRWDPSARGAFVGLTVGHGETELIRSVAEGIVMNLRLILDVFAELGARRDVVRTVGGAAASRFWNQLMADVFAVPVRPMRHLADATSMGAAVAAGVGVGLYEGFDIIDTMNPVGDAVAPDPAATRAYERQLSAFEAMYQALSPAFALQDQRRMAASDE